MNKAEATVIVAGPGVATVSVEAAPPCARCAAGRGCGAGLLQAGRNSFLQVKVVDALVLEPGDRVSLQLAPADLLQAAWLGYGLPLVALVLSVAAASFLGAASDLLLVAFGVCGLIAGIYAGRRALQRNNCLQHLVPVACEKILAQPRAAGVNPSCGG